MPETASHMMATCSFSVQVWNTFAYMGIVPHQLPPGNYRRLKRWWASMLGMAGVQNAKRCRRVFDNKAMTSDRLITIIQQEYIQDWNRAQTPWEEPNLKGCSNAFKNLRYLP
ncbi:hypothetical protein EJB05_50386, partial [Eragrostis curvula]